jgi:prolipoprotein diacylglyceryltransferase
VGAALWAQWVEGSPALLRPMGFYGGMLGAVVGAVPAVLAHVDLWFVLGAICVGAPWIQGIGRLRCLVQGCCHGRATESMDGIRYTHSRTRVCRLAHLGGVPIHATQVYSMACNAVVGLALLRLLELHVSAPFLCGIYLLLSGAGRFVEEAYRGEPQTMTVCGLHLYQWIAAGCMVAGAVLTCVRGAALTGKFDMRISTILIAFGCGAIAWFVTGMDFPESSRRFARLT